MTLQIRLAEGGQIETPAEALLENPLPPGLRITEVRFQIHKGLRYHFQTLVFDGLITVPEKQARSYFMETETLLHPKGTRVFTPERLDRGLSSLTDVLDRQGYRDAKAEAASVDRNDHTGAVNVRVRVGQGPKFIVRSAREEFLYEGVAQPAETITTHPDKPYSHLWVQDFSLSLKTNQFHRGYPDVTVEVTPIQSEPRGNRVLVDLLATVKTGPLVWVSGVTFLGQQRTRVSLLQRRVRIQRGDLLDPIRAEQGRYRLSSLGIFDTVDLDYQPPFGTNRAVVYRLKEGKRLNLSLLFGYGSYELLRGGFEAEQNNIWGLAHHARLKAIQSFKSSSGELTYTIPELVGRDVDLFLTGAGLRRQELDFLRLEYGGGFGLHKYFPSAATDISARYSYQILSALDAFPAIASVGLTNPAVGSVTLDLKHDRRDNPLYPRKGYRIFATLETAGQALGGEANYQRNEIFSSWYHPLGGGLYLSLGLSHGVAIPFGSPQNNLPFDKRFFPGGESSIRGYTEGEASPRNQFGQIIGAETYVLGQVELEQALTPQWSVVVFSDSLGFARSLQHYPFDTGLFSVGIGVRWKTLIGPVRLEYGYNLNPRPLDPVGTLQFSLGFPF
jgi:outer membrane protein assembly complex protein YaeT